MTRRLALLLPLVLLIPVTVVTHAAVFEARVASVEAGDRIVIVTQVGRRELRIAGIDAPDEGQEYDNRCRRELGRILRNAHVLVQTAGDEYDAVGQVAVKRTDAGLHQLEKGCAWVLKDDLTRLPDGWAAAYLEAERKAISAPLGLWKSERPVPPWTWLKMKKAPFPVEVWGFSLGADFSDLHGLHRLSHRVIIALIVLGGSGDT